MLQKPYLLQKRDKNLNLWYDMICQKMGSKNVDLACTWYSVSVMGPKQGFELVYLHCEYTKYHLVKLIISLKRLIIKLINYWINSVSVGTNTETV